MSQRRNKRQPNVTRVLPSKEEEEDNVVTITFRWKRSLIAELDSVAKDVGYSRNEAGARIVKWGIAQHKAELEAEKRKK